MNTEAWDREIYELYPRKVGKRVAVRAIAKARQRLHGGESGKALDWSDCQHYLCEKTREYSESPAGNRGNYTPHPSTFFNQSRYLDAVEQWYQQTEDERLRALNQVGVWRP